MKKIAAVLMTVGCILGFGGMAMAADLNSSSHSATYAVAAIDEIAVDATSISLVVDSATAGSSLDQDSATSSYSITTNGTGRTITAKIGEDTPDYVDLKVSLTAPDGATSAGAVKLTTVPTSVVTGVTQVIGENLSMAYTLDALVTAGVVANATPSVTFTITDSGA